MFINKIFPIIPIVDRIYITQNPRRECSGIKGECPGINGECPGIIGQLSGY